MLKIKKKKLYSFDYEIHWKSGGITKGAIIHSQLPPEKIFLENKITYVSNNNSAWYYNLQDIRNLEITNLIEKVESEE